MQNSVRGTYVTDNPTEHIENSAQNTSDKKATEHIKNSARNSNVRNSRQNT